VQRIFPEAHVLRIDSDNIKNERLEHRYDDIIQGKVDILVGTQALAKGLDLPRLSTLGIIAADTSLFLPDYTAKERTYQLLTQVLGRIGRGHVNSQAVIQTYQPDSPLIDTALHDNWDNFYASEIEERRQFGYPPFVHILKLSCKRTSAASSEKAANTCKAKLLAHHVGIVVDGPAPAFHEKSGKYYRWQLIIKARNRQKLLQVLQSVPKGWSYDLDPMDLL
jgi:primosomal protein N' (replication factor Y)